MPHIRSLRALVALALLASPAVAIDSSHAETAGSDPICQGKLRLQSVRFDRSSDRIRVEDSVVLDEAVRILTACPEVDVRIEGHTDANGSDAFNQDLSERRARAVKRYLVRAGIAADRLEAVGRGRSEPLVAGEGESAHRMNRRVTLEFRQRAG